MRLFNLKLQLQNCVNNCTNDNFKKQQEQQFNKLVQKHIFFKYFVNRN